MSTQLSDYFNKCRCCLEDLNGKAAYNITDFFEAKFYEVTQLNVNMQKKITNFQISPIKPAFFLVNFIRTTINKNLSTMQLRSHTNYNHPEYSHSKSKFSYGIVCNKHKN